MSNTFYAYGVDTTKDRFRWKKDAAALLMEKAMKIDRLSCKYNEKCKEDPDIDIETFVVEYENDNPYGHGIEALFTEVLNENVDTKKELFFYDDGCIYVSATIPEDEDARKAMLTQKQIRKLFAEHLNPLIEEPVSVEWLVIPE